MAKNPVSRIMQVETTGESLVTETRKQKLAEYPGMTLDRAHKGELQVAWSDSTRLCRASRGRCEH